MDREHEMRVTRSDRPAAEREVRDALLGLDPAVEVRLAAETGILHVRSTRDTLDLLDALAQAGFEAGAATG